MNTNKASEMEEQFCEYQESFDMKEFGFDEPCLGLFENKKLGFSFAMNDGYVTPIKHKCNSMFVKNILTNDCCTAPTYQQAFDFFENKYGLEGVIQRVEDFSWFKFTIYENGKKFFADGHEIKTRKEARFMCLKILIDIVKCELPPTLKG
ncbi:MAG: hypothetical protein WC026_13220 [Hyphomicrobium sp.]|uniref:hypothetical protein n=1 Tax=Hyphomicrobium sp. TaxID=82 RepID=UPI003569141B